MPPAVPSAAGCRSRPRAEALSRKAVTQAPRHLPELVGVLARDGYDAFRERWTELVDPIIAELTGEHLARLRKLRVGGSA